MITGPTILPSEPFLGPSLSDSAIAFIRVAYGILLLGTLLMALPHTRRFFLSDRWGGYAKSEPLVDIFQNPFIQPLILAIWLSCAILLILNQWSVWAGLANLLLCRYFFIATRWKGVLRGMGAPGFMTYWLAAVVFLLEYARQQAPHLQSLVVLVAQVDFALIMLSAGIYKFTAGYPRNHGMELGMVNPEWGYWWRFYSRMPPRHWLFKGLNQLAWSTEVVAALMMLYPPTRFLGGVIIILSFVFIATQIRLGLLCQMVIVGGVLFFHPGSTGDQLVERILSGQVMSPPAVPAAPLWLNHLLQMALTTYLVLLPLAHAGLFYNFYARKSLPPPWQRLLERYTNFFGIIIWRVFSVDVVNFFLKIHTQARNSTERVLVSRYGGFGLRRFNHVAESITVTSLFTTLKYYSRNFDLFRDRLLRYARTIPCPPDSVLVFEYVSIQKRTARFDFVPLAEYHVDPSAGSVFEHLLEKGADLRSAAEGSPVFEGRKPGSYAPSRP